MPVVPLTLQVQFPYRTAGAATAVNVLHFLDIGGAFSQSNMDTLCQAWRDEMEAPLSDDWTLGGTVRCLDLSSDPPGEIYADAPENFGDVTGNALPPACAAVISLSAGADRRRRGRIYFPGQTGANYTADGIMSPSYVSLLAASFTLAATAIATNCGYVPAVYSRTDGVSRAVQSAGVEDVLDTQRRRQQRLAS